MFLWGDAYLAQQRDPFLWVVQDLIPVGGKANLFGKPKAGKSFLALQMACAISSGHPHFLGFPILKHGPVAYIQIDTSASIWFARVKEDCKDWGSLGYSFEKVAFADTDTGTPFPLNILADAPKIKAALTEIKPVLVIWDTIRETHPGDENDSSVMKNVVSQLLETTRGDGWVAANLFLSHRKKENPNYEDDLMNANRGSSYLAGACDSIMQLTSTNLEFQSRTHKFTRRPISFNEDLNCFELNAEEERINAAVATVLHTPGVSDRERCRTMAAMLGITEEAARGLFKRRKKGFAKLVK